MNVRTCVERAVSAGSLVLAGLVASAASSGREPAITDPRWAAIGRVFGQRGQAEGYYFRIDLPRTDLHVRIGRDWLSPRFAFTSDVGFIPMNEDRVMGMGEMVLRDDEVPAVLEEAHRREITVSAVHNHLIGETPRIVYVHVMAEGEAADVATRLRSVYAKSATPLSRREEPESKANWSAIDAVLGPHEEAEGSVAEYVFPRNEHLAVREIPIESTGLLESASEVVFEHLPGGRVACTGELFVLPSEVDPVARALDEHGLHVTAIHNHMIDETPLMYWIHWYATGDGPKLARGVAAALAHTNSRKLEPRTL